MIDFRKIHEKRREDEMRRNPARWAGGYLDYQRRMNPRWDVGERVQFRRTRRRVRLPAHRHLNPYRGNPGKGAGIGFGTLALLGVGGFLAYQYFKGGSLFGPTATTPAQVPQGYVPVGNGLYRGPDGALYARNPTTGAMVRAPVGSTPQDAESLLMQAGVALIPQGANMLANWVGGLFGSQRSATTPAPGTTYATRPPTPSASTVPSSGLPIGAAAPLIPALPAIGSALSSNWPVVTGTDYPPIPGDVLTASGEDIEALAYGTPEIPTAPGTDIMATDSSWWESTEPDGMFVDTLPDADTGWMDWAQYEMPTYDYGFDMPTYDVALPEFDYAFDAPTFDIPEFDYGAADMDFGFMGFGARRRRSPTTAVRGYGRRPASIG